MDYVFFTKFDTGIMLITHTKTNYPY